MPHSTEHQDSCHYMKQHDFIPCHCCPQDDSKWKVLITGKAHTQLRDFILFQISASWNGIEILYYRIPSGRDIEKVWGDSAQGYSAVTYEKDFGILYISAFRNPFFRLSSLKDDAMPSIRQTLIYPEM